MSLIFHFRKYRGLHHSLKFTNIQVLEAIVKNDLDTLQRLYKKGIRALSVNTTDSVPEVCGHLTLSEWY